MIPLLIPILATLVPDLIKHLVGDQAAEVSTKVIDVVRAVTGTDDPAAVTTALTDPSKATELQLALAKVLADSDAITRQTELAALTAGLADVADARRQTISLAAGNSPIAYGAPVVSGMVVLGFFGLLSVLAFVTLPAGSTEILFALAGILAAKFGTVVDYWTGSSSSGRAKDAIIGGIATGGAAIPSRPLV